MSRRRKRRRDRDTRLLLADLARALNACDRAGIGPSFAHGAVFTPRGYVLPIGGKKGTWVVRMPAGRGKR